MIPTKQKKGKSSRLREERERNKKLFLPKAKDNKDIKMEKEERGQRIEDKRSFQLKKGNTMTMM